MRTLIPTVFVILAAGVLGLSGAPANAADWVEYLRSGEYGDFFDQDSISRWGSNVMVRAYYSELRWEEVFNANVYTVQTIEYDCQSWQFRLRKITAHNAETGEYLDGREYAPDDPTYPFEAIPGGGRPELLARIVCR